jgi:predicted metal-dependent enzyme (double-stranded beta helix superfamily)
VTSSRILERPLARPQQATLASIARMLVPEAVAWSRSCDRQNRSWELLAQCEAFEAWAIIWPPAGGIELHDHGGSEGAVVVAEGSLIETRIVAEEAGGFGTRLRRISAGAVLELQKSCIHDVENSGDATALSVHVYAPRLTAMTYYEMADGLLEKLKTVRYDCD